MENASLKKIGFPPVFNGESELLILGSFPSVKSREIQFYYGNKQNRFWKTVCGFFGEEIPIATAGKIEFLHRRKIALWDMVTECEIEGSSDTTVKNAVVADLNLIFQTAKIKKILLNGALAHKLFCERYKNAGIPYYKMPSTSPANPRFNAEIWRERLNDLR